jgi:antitoxin (DNA-binding transcriptional repressor) of toxin-antitoxin stability system
MANTRTITPLDLRRSLGRILDEASAGQRFLIERDHKPLAILIPVEDASRLDESPEEAAERRKKAWAALHEYAERVGRHLGDPNKTAAQLVQEARDARERKFDRWWAGDYSEHPEDV